MYRGGRTELVSPGWVEKNIFGHGAPGECYPMYQGGDPFEEVQGIKEGDTPSFLHLIPHGTHNPERPWEEGWGGQFYPVKNTKECRHFSDAEILPVDAAKSISRWRGDFQEDFAKRIRWCMESSYCLPALSAQTSNLKRPQ